MGRYSFVFCLFFVLCSRLSSAYTANTTATGQETSPSQSGTCALQIGDCGYYFCLSKHLNCREKDYPQRFGYKYCQRFVAQNALYSEQGQVFLESVRVCLQEELEHETQLTCQNVERRSARHHIACYLESGYCQLPATDQWRIQRTITADILLRPTLWNAAMEISRACAASSRAHDPSATP